MRRNCSFSLCLDVDVFKLFFTSQVAAGKVLPVNSIFAHIELKNFGDCLFVVQFHEVEPHIFPDEVDELLVGDFSKTFEPGDLHSRLELCNGFFLLFLIVAVDVGFAVLDPEERGLEDVHVSSSYHRHQSPPLYCCI